MGIGTAKIPMSKLIHLKALREIISRISCLYRIFQKFRILRFAFITTLLSFILNARIVLL